MLLEDILSEVNKKYPLIKGKEVSAGELLFEERVKMNCFYCEKYKNNWKCPPNIPEIDYSKMFSEFDNLAFLYVRMKLDSEKSEIVRRESSTVLHKALLEAEKYLYMNNNSIALSFIGGSCKLCKNGCGLEKCNNPYMARTPMEATGVNVIKSAENVGINISFPTDTEMIRLGLLLW